MIRRHLTTLVFALLLHGAVDASAQRWGKKKPEPEVAKPAGVPGTMVLMAARGHEIYNRACVACHGRLGDGQGPGSRYLDPAPRDFTSGTYKFRSTPSGALPTDDDLLKTITYGVPGTSMPAFEDLLSASDRRDVVRYIKTFSEKFGQLDPVEPVEIPDEPNVTAESVAEGKNVYMLSACWTCHGAGGDGRGATSDALQDEWGNKIKPYNLTSPMYKAGDDGKSIFKTLTTGLNGTPMPSFDGMFQFGGEVFGDLSSYREVYSNAEINTLRAYLESQPEDARMSNMSVEESVIVINRRKWALVHYVKSLQKKSSAFHKLFVQDSEVTQQKQN